MRLFYLFSIMLISTVAKSQNLKCEDFKIGTFKILDSSSKNLIYRTETLQKEGEDERNN